ncbi:ABC transporter permease [Brevibacterium litoralis]|uniref:ABC transporter permease n=1 Tax=Brevibacterium litoralis TaxID=3138935 RepID=UPI0032F0510E
MSYTDPDTWKSSITVPSWVLRPVGVRPPLEEYFKQLWRRRHFILAESVAKVFSANRKNLMGNAWLVLNPVMQGLMYFLIFGVILQLSRGVENFIGFLIVGLFYFFFTTRTISSATKVISSGRSMIRAFAFPRAALPISLIVKETLSFFITFVAMIALVIAIPPAEELTWRVVLLIPSLLMQIAFLSGCAFIMARLGHKLPDVSNLMMVITRFWMYGSEVIFPLSRFIQDPFWQSIVQLNPMWIYININRNSLLYGVDSAAWEWVLGAGWGLGFLVLGFLYFYRGEEEYGRERN